MFKRPTIIIFLEKETWHSGTVLEEIHRYKYDSLETPMPRVGEGLSINSKAYLIKRILHCIDQNEVRIGVKESK